MYLNIAAAWKDLAQLLEDGSMREVDIEMCRRAFYIGAGSALDVRINIMREHDKKAASILLKALMKEVDDVVRHSREAEA
jgi:hypothetical protein